MRTISHPLRLDNAGAVVTIEEGTDRQAAELAGAVVATTAGERGLAPDYGLPDPVGSGVSAGIIAAAVTRCEPDLAVTTVTASGDQAGQTTVALSVTWAE